MSVATRKSDTHEERYFHLKIGNSDKLRAATVFFRKETGGWFAAASLCSIADQFNRRAGRTWARRRYFNLGHQGVAAPSYAAATLVALEAIETLTDDPNSVIEKNERSV